jgi:replicative DNA helicase
LTAAYQWAREQAKTYCPVIGVCQAGATAENKKYLSMDDIAESKTGKAGEADWILGIGKVHDDHNPNKRYLSILKNKLTGDEDTIEELRHGKVEVEICPTIARYGDLVL